MFNRFVRAVVLHDDSIETPGPLTAQALGLVHLPQGRTDNELLEEALAEKHRD
jgi:hypothetical protein